MCEFVSKFRFGMEAAWLEHMEDTGELEVLFGPTKKRTWSEEFNGRAVAETVVPSLTVNEVARRHNLR